MTGTTRNTSLDVGVDEGIRNWVTHHVDHVSNGLNEKLDIVTNIMRDIMLQLRYLVNDVNRLKGGEGSSRFSRMGKLEFPKFYGDDVQR